ncbi:replication-relaxation family protein [Dactylosporangium salmoneum]|uniref:Replication-relaxation n=1 Tax=Dactylosporangium salmoneum TaxID=53361 RepID=A0ABP5TCU9_9ACTN
MPGTDPTRHFPAGEVSRPGNHRTHQPRTTDAGPPTHGSTLIQISHRLRPRDYAIAALLHEHTMLTTDQLTAILFTNPITCRHRLGILRSIGFVDRFIRRNQPGTPNVVCWVAGPLSSRMTALAAGESPPTPKALRERQDRIYASPTLDHLIAVNWVGTRLLARSRADRTTSLLRWWSERTTANRFGQRIHPDGHGIWAAGDRQVGFFLELDRGTEPIGKVADKLTSHRRLTAEGGPTYPILFALPSRTREQHLHRRLAERPEPTLVVATTSPESGTDPADPVWRLAGNGRHRLALADLPASHGQPGPLNPGPPTAAEHPLRHTR